MATVDVETLIRRRKLNRFKSKFNTRIYPFTANSVILAVCVVLGLLFGGVEPIANVVTSVQNAIAPFVMSHESSSLLLACVICGLAMCLTPIRLTRLILRRLLAYKQWMHETNTNATIRSKITLGLLSIVSRCNKPVFHSFEDLVPSLPIPNLNKTLDRHLKSMHPLLSEDQYKELVHVSDQFRNGLGPKLQSWLKTKFKHSHNYVTDWWTEHKYLRNRDSVMKNCYAAMDMLHHDHTPYPAARGAQLVMSAIELQQRIENDKIKAITAGPVPFCPKQFDLWYNTCRIPGYEIDAIKHWNDSFHIAVYCKGCWYSIPTHVGTTPLQAPDYEKIFQEMLDSNERPSPGESSLAALTSLGRCEWAIIRDTHFSEGVNKESLDAIESALFILVFDDVLYEFDRTDESKLNSYCREVMLGNGHNRWFDKSMQWMVSANAKTGVLFEHSWGDGLIGATVGEFFAQHGALEVKYTDDGHMAGKAVVDGTVAKHLPWDLNIECQKSISEAVVYSEKFRFALENSSLAFEEYGKGFVKQQKLSPDAYFHMAVQLAFFKDQGRHPLTYHAATAGLFYNGRTETIRSMTDECAKFVQLMCDPKSEKSACIDALRSAATEMKSISIRAMSGEGIDRHLFALYVAAQTNGHQSAFLDYCMSEPWALWTSNAPTGMANMVDFKKRPDLCWTAGISWPIEHGYGVGQVVWEDWVIFHLTSTRMAPNTNADRMRLHLMESLHEMAALFN